MSKFALSCIRYILRMLIHKYIMYPLMHLPNVSIFIQSFSQWSLIFSGEMILYTIVKCLIRLDFNPFYSALYTKVVCNLETQPLIWVFNNLEKYPENICNVMISTVPLWICYCMVFFFSELYNVYDRQKVFHKMYQYVIVKSRDPLGCKSSGIFPHST